MHGIKKQINAFLDKLEELFTESISNRLFMSPRLWGQHTFSKNTINRLVASHGKNNSKYIQHPYTRENLYIEQIKELPENTIINDLILIFWYSKTIEIDNQTLKNILVYFIKCLLIQQKKINQTTHLLNAKNEIQDLLLKELAEFLECTKEIVEILSSTTSLKKHDYNRPSNFHLNGILFMAIKQNNYRLINLLLHQIKIDVNIEDKKGKTALYWACCNGLKYVAEILIGWGANVNVQDLTNRTTPLFWACYHGELELAEILLENGAKINAKDVKGQTPLFWACYHGQYEVAEMLINHHAHLEIKDLRGQTPFKIAYNRRNAELAEMLIDYGALGGYSIKDHHTNKTLLLWVYESQQGESRGIKTTKARFHKKASPYRYLAY